MKYLFIDKLPVWAGPITHNFKGLDCWLVCEQACSFRCTKNTYCGKYVANILYFNSLYDRRYVRSAFFFKTMEGFLEAGPQFALQVTHFKNTVL